MATSIIRDTNHDNDIVITTTSIIHNVATNICDIHDLKCQL